MLIRRANEHYIINLICARIVQVLNKDRIFLAKFKLKFFNETRYHTMQSTSTLCGLETFIRIQNCYNKNVNSV